MYFISRERPIPPAPASRGEKTKECRGQDE